MGIILGLVDIPRMCLLYVSFSGAYYLGAMSPQKAQFRRLVPSSLCLPFMFQHHLQDGFMVSHTHTQTHTTILWPCWILSGTTWVSRHQKSKTSLDLLEQELVRHTYQVDRHVQRPLHRYCELCASGWGTLRLVSVWPWSQARLHCCTVPVPPPS